MVRMLDQDWALVREATDNLEKYLLSSEMYWPLISVPRSTKTANSPQLSIGSLRLSLKRLSGPGWSAPQQLELEQIETRVEGVHDRWRMNWARKARSEYSNRLRLWSNALAELADEQGPRGGGYSSDVRWRTILQLLAQDLGEEVDREEQALAGLDHRLRAVTEPVPFIWEPEVQPAFPESTYWYLYRAVKV